MKYIYTGWAVLCPPVDRLDWEDSFCFCFAHTVCFNHRQCNAMLLSESELLVCMYVCMYECMHVCNEMNVFVIYLVFSV